MEEHGHEPEEEDSRYHIEFFFDDLEPQLLSPGDQRLLRQALVAALQHQGVGHAEISVAVVSGKQMRELNNRYLQHDYDTDILSFCLNTEAESGFLLGQLIVSLDFAQQQARLLSQESAEVLWQHEMALYLVHGALHLLGYADQEPTDRETMRRLERDVLATVGIVPVWLEATDAKDCPSESTQGQLPEQHP